MSNGEKEILLEECIRDHEKGECNCISEEVDICIGGQYLSGNITKEEIIDGWK